MKRDFMMTKCVHCHKEVPFGKYCCYCGIPQISAIKEHTAILCKHCGNEVFASNFCTFCGKPIKPQNAKNQDDFIEKR